MKKYHNVSKVLIIGYYKTVIQKQEFGYDIGYQAEFLF